MGGDKMGFNIARIERVPLFRKLNSLPQFI